MTLNKIKLFETIDVDNADFNVDDFMKDIHDNHTLIYNDDNKALLASIARTANSIDGSFDPFCVSHDFEDFFGLDDDYSPTDIANMVHYGNYDPDADWYRVDDDDNVVSFTNDELNELAWDYRNQLIAWIIDNFDEVAFEARQLVFKA